MYGHACTVCICMHVNAQVCVHIYKCTCTMRMCIYTSIHMCVCMHVGTYMHTYCHVR